MKPVAIFLTADQVLEAVCADLRQYEPQIALMCNVMRLVTGDSGSIIRGSGNACIWIKRDGRPGLKQIDPAHLVTETCRRLAQVDIPIATWVAICRQVFQTRVTEFKDAADGRHGVLIETGMGDFICRQCGHCCRHLEYRHELMAEDVQRWRETDRQDILEWVAETKTAQGTIAYQIWKIPGTNRFADTCPFLKQGATNHQWHCAIHDVKPFICRQYPITRKHATMTGCQGNFND